MQFIPSTEILPSDYYLIVCWLCLENKTTKQNKTNKNNYKCNCHVVAVVVVIVVVVLLFIVTYFSEEMSWCRSGVRVREELVPFERSHKT